MLLISYDFGNDKTRTKFSKFLEKFGRRLQYSVFEIKNSKRVLQNIMEEVEYTYKKQFTGADSILIFQTCDGCNKKIKRYGYAVNDEKEVVLFT
ncbi:CRISPR-associated endonuclease Cas2 [Candidatus Parcubacteria bacterium]|nr:CRISPR-associated endonuclease Cas2 [Candidatus Parcubacteria bacterium]